MILTRWVSLSVLFFILNMMAARRYSAGDIPVAARNREAKYDRLRNPMLSAIASMVR